MSQPPPKAGVRARMTQLAQPRAAYTILETLLGV